VLFQLIRFKIYFLFINKILKYYRYSLLIMTEKEITDDELEDELDKAFKESERLRDHCGTLLPSNKEVGIQRTDVKLKKD